MKLSISIILILFSFLVNCAQAPSERERLLVSKGNLKVSSLFNEAPVLPIDDRMAEIYRMTIIPTFSNPIKVRVERHNSNYVVVAKRLSGQGGFDAGKLKTEKDAS